MIPTSAMAFTYFFRDSHRRWNCSIRTGVAGVARAGVDPIWDAGCASGAEPYTLAMLLREQMSDQIFRNVRIHATDVDRAVRPANRRGDLSRSRKSSEFRIPFRYRYFQVTDEPGYVQVVDEIRARCRSPGTICFRWRRRADDFSLIVCKNVLLHFDEAERRQVFRMFHGAMRAGGLLATEQTQKMPEGFEGLFEPLRVMPRCIAVWMSPTISRAHIDGSHALRGDRVRKGEFENALCLAGAVCCGSRGEATFFIVSTQGESAMFVKMKTGTKVLAGFSFAMVVAVIVGLVGYVGINKFSGHVEEIGVVRMPSVQALLEIKVGSEQIKNAQRTLLNAGLDSATRQRQSDNMKKRRQVRSRLEDLRGSSADRRGSRALEAVCAGLAGMAERQQRVLPSQPGSR